MALTEQSIRVLVIDNLAVESLRREVYRILARTYGFEVHLLVPTAWRETRGVASFEPEEGDAIHVHPSRITFGFRHQRVLYRGLSRVVRRVHPHFILAVAQPESYAAAQICLARRVYEPRARLGLFCSRNIDYRRKGFPYRLAFTHELCDYITRKSRPDICFYRPKAADDLFASYAKRLVYVPHVVDCTLFRRCHAGVQEAGEKEFVIGYVGRLVKEKGVHILVDAVRQLPQRVRLRLIGEGPEDTPLRGLVEASGLTSRVEFHPPIPYGEMPAALNALDLLVLPSLDTERWTELFGRVLIEAMACELPVVASYSGGIPEVLGDAGRLVSPGDSAVLAEAIGRLCADEDSRNHLARKGRERALSRFDVHVVADLLGREIMKSVRPSAVEGRC